LDLMMPALDGAGVLDALRARPNPPRVVIVTSTDVDSAVAVSALHAGAFDLVHKPTSLATDRLYELRDELVSKVVAAANGQMPPRIVTPVRRASAGVRPTSTSILTIVTSTGGPRALTLLLGALPRDFPVPVFAVVHMPPGFTYGLATRLSHDCALDVFEADEGRVVGPGEVAIGRAGTHLRVDATFKARLGGGPSDSLHRPSGDVLFESAAAAHGRRVLGVVLTGMGSDGLVGARAIRAAGGRILAESAASSVVYGMPRVVAEAGLAEVVVPLEEMADAILTRL
jgi:two-component system chemotaxis response regulator CheB